jgi:hypothetical protein
MFRALIGDLFASQAQTLVNTVNCVGVMGKGVALEFKKRWPAMFEDYRRRCDAKQVRLGEPCLYRDASGTSIVNFPTKDHWRSPSRVADIESDWTTSWPMPTGGAFGAWHCRHWVAGTAAWGGARWVRSSIGSFTTHRSMWKSTRPLGRRRSS